MRVGRKPPISNTDATPGAEQSQEQAWKRQIDSVMGGGYERMGPAPVQGKGDAGKEDRRGKGGGGGGFFGNLLGKLFGKKKVK